MNAALSLSIARGAGVRLIGLPGVSRVRRRAIGLIADSAAVFLSRSGRFGWEARRDRCSVPSLAIYQRGRRPGFPRRVKPIAGSGRRKSMQCIVERLDGPVWVEFAKAATPLIGAIKAHSEGLNSFRLSCADGWVFTVIDGMIVEGSA